MGASSVDDPEGLDIWVVGLNFPSHLKMDPFQLKFSLRRLDELLALAWSIVLKKKYILRDSKYLLNQKYLARDRN
jgi:hypothetical protein